jgi:hypothetical protein
MVPMLPTSLLSDVVRKWDTARKGLDDALQDYLDSCVSLEAAVSQPLGHFPDNSLLEETLLEVQDELPSLSLRHRHLDTANAYLNRIKNRSTSSVPINTLPLEVLLGIFKHAVGRSCSCDYHPSKPKSSQHYSRNTLLAVTHVSTDWREICTSTPFFWSHVTFSFDHADISKPLNYAQMFLERSHNTPLSIHVGGRRGVTARMTERLRPYLKRVVSLHTEHDCSASTIREVVGVWLAEGSVGLAQELVTLNTRVRSQWLLTSHTLPETLVDSFTLRLRVLRLSCVNFPWKCAAYRGLVDLQLNRIARRGSPTLKEMLQILAASAKSGALNLA